MQLFHCCKARPRLPWPIRLTGLLLALLLGGVLVIQTRAAPAARPLANLAPTYRIFATREGLVGQQTANGHIIQPRDRFVALPSWRVLSSYQGYEYQVRLTYGNRSVVVPVWDVGPWNTNDNYWSPNRGTFPDLPIGIPQAEAAYFDGHNGGLDEFGRPVNNPNGIDIADGTFWDDLGMVDNDWVDVSFLWLGDDPGPGAAVQVPIPAPPVAAPEPVPQEEEPPAAPVAAPAPPTAEPLDSPLIEAGATAVDNSDPGYTGDQAAWETFRCGVNGDHVWAYTSDAASNQQATWAPDLPAGTYAIKAYIPPCGDVEATRAARYLVRDTLGTHEIVIDQQATAGTWVSLGIRSFSSETPPAVELGTATDDVGRAVRVDATSWLALPDDTPPVARIVRIVRQGNGYLVEWAGEDDLSGIVSYDVQVRQLPKGSWRQWGTDTLKTNAWFGPDEGDHFAFRVRARDRAGNEGLWPLDEGVEVMDTRQAEPEPEP